MDVITDGELRRSNWADTPDFLDCFDKIAGNTGGLRWRGGESTPVRWPRGRLRHRRQARRHAKRTGDRTAQYAFLVEHANVRTKFTLPSPSYHRRYWWDEVSGAVYDSAEEYLIEIRDVLREVVDRVVELGCDYIQLDAPNYGSLCDPDNRARLEAAGRGRRRADRLRRRPGQLAVHRPGRGDPGRARLPGQRARRPLALPGRIRRHLRPAVPAAGRRPVAARVRHRAGRGVRPAGRRAVRRGRGARPADH